MSKEYDVVEVVAHLTRKGVKFTGKVAEVKAGNLGINTLGKLDFLGRNGYIVKYIR